MFDDAGNCVRGLWLYLRDDCQKWKAQAGPIWAARPIHHEKRLRAASDAACHGRLTFRRVPYATTSSSASSHATQADRKASCLSFKCWSCLGQQSWVTSSTAEPEVEYAFDSEFWRLRREVELRPAEIQDEALLATGSHLQAVLRRDQLDVISPFPTQGTLMPDLGASMSKTSYLRNHRLGSL
ncbi:hypothetical protein WJX84_008104 [Apatococcus fuscideae]|uniref:Uncharacterized protein n=1 Tax=Apatococcus fuscideae TaxID=2026836 RepID=A0AAW1TIZ9_9CHLO